MRIQASVVGALIWFTAASAAQPVSAAPSQQAPPLNAAVQAKVDTDVRALLSAAHVPGATIAIVQGGAIVYTRGYGLRDVAKSLPADAHTRYEIGSITKQFTAAAILQLKEAGKIDVDATVATYLPSISHAREITIRQLLTHTSGLDEYVNIPNFETRAATPATFDQLMSRIAEKPLGFTPGSAFGYSSTNYLILGRVIEVVSGQSWEAYVQQHLFAPAGMMDSATMAEEGQLANMARGYVYAQGRTAESKPIAESWASSAGGIVSTADDLQKWGEALASGRIISTSDYQLLTSPARLADGSTSEYGFGMKIDRFEGQPRLWHDGNTNGFDGSDQFFPSQGVRIIVLTNTLDGGSDKIAEHIYNDLFPAIASAAPTADEQLYAKTIATMRDLPKPPYLTFVVNITSRGVRKMVLLNNHGFGVFRVCVNGNEQPSVSWGASYRASDDLASVANTPQSHLLSHLALFSPTWTGAYDWLRYGLNGRPPVPKSNPQPSPAPTEQLKTIGMVRALGPSSYRISAANPTICPGGQQGRHLQLTPRDGDIQKHPLTDVTIDLASRRFCSMRFHAPGNGIGISFSELRFGTVNGYFVTTDVNTDFRGYGQFGIGGHRGEWRITYDEMRFPDKLDDAIFSLPDGLEGPQFKPGSGCN